MNLLKSDWFNDLSFEEQSFIKKFIIASGSLKELAATYQVTYPTVRLRLDRLIAKIMLTESSSEDSYIKVLINNILNSSSGVFHVLSDKPSIVSV